MTFFDYATVHPILAWLYLVTAGVFFVAGCSRLSDLSGKITMLIGHGEEKEKS